MRAVQISCVERDEWDMTQSLDASGQPDVLSLPSGGTRISLSAETSAQGKSQRSETAESVKKKRPRDNGVDSSESAASRKPMSSKTQVGGQFDEGVIEIDDASEGPPATTTDSRSSKRTRTGVEAISTALPQASASTPTGKGREKATTRHQGILSGAHGQELLPAVGMSPATARRQNAVEKETAEKTRGAETGQSTNHAATQSPLCRPAAAGSALHGVSSFDLACVLFDTVLYVTIMHPEEGMISVVYQRTCMRLDCRFQPFGSGC